MIRNTTNGDISDEEFEAVLKPFLDNYDEFIESYIMPEIIAYYIANSFNRNSMYSGTFDQHYNSAKDMLNLFNEDYETVKSEVFKLLKIKYALLVIIAPASNNRFSDRKNKNCEKAGVKQIRLHDFRHSCASLLIYKGASINMISKFLGHSKIEETLNTYTHLYSNALSDITNLIDEMNES